VLFEHFPPLCARIVKYQHIKEDLRSDSGKVKIQVEAGLLDFDDRDFVAIRAFASAKLQHVSGVAKPDENHVLITDTHNNRIVSYELRTGRISDWPVRQ